MIGNLIFDTKIYLNLSYELHHNFLEQKFLQKKLLNYQGNKIKSYGFHAIGLNMIIIKSQSKVLVEFEIKELFDV